MFDNLIGYEEDPINGHGIIRARTTINLRYWEFARDLGTLNVINREFGASQFPGLYVLFQGARRCYVGESSNIFHRLTQHINNPPQAEINNWDRLILLNDGRISAQSWLNDQAVRMELENFLKELLRFNRYNVLSQASAQELNPGQRRTTNILKSEIQMVLHRRAIITRFLPDIDVRVIMLDELQQILEREGYTFARSGELSRNHAVRINGEVSFYRPGSEKSRGWQITFRGTFLEHLESGIGNLLVNRDGIIIVPLSTVQEVVEDEDAYNQNTIDVHVVFDDDNIYLEYGDARIDITEFRVL